MGKELTTNKRKGLIATLLIHAIILLLMLQWMLKTDKALAEDDGGLMVTFNTVQSGGPDETTEFSESSESAQEDDQPQSEEVVTETQPTPVQPTNKPETVTTDAQEAPEVVAEKETKPVKEERQLDQSLKNRLSKLGRTNKTSNSDKDQRSGDGLGNEGTGSPDADNSGPGGSGIGTQGPGKWDGNFGGFSISGGRTIHADIDETGIVILDICVDKSGKIIINGLAPGTTNYNAQLLKLAKDAANSYKFTPRSGTTTGGCGTFKVTFDIK